MREYCVLLSVLVLTGSTSAAYKAHVEVSPRVSHIHASHPTAVVCRLRDEHNRSVPLSHCQFNWLSDDHVDIHKDIIDFSAGHKSKIQHEIEYHGNGLEHGECGFKLRGGHFKEDLTRVYECRVMATNQRGWHYGSHMVQVTAKFKDMDFQLYPKEAVVLKGGGIDFSGIADRKITACHIFTPNVWFINLSYGHLSRYPHAGVDANHRYFGLGLQNKSCGVSLRNVTLAINGYIAVKVMDAGNVHLRQDMARLIVATAPDRPKLQLRHFDSTSVETTSEFEAGDYVHATCTVANSRPVSNLTWLLGDDVVRQDTEDESPDNEDKWWWSFDPQNITQHWYYTLSMDDDGKELTCRAEHVALPSSKINTSIRITVKRSASAAPDVHLEASPRVNHIHASRPSTIVCTLRNEHNHSVPLTHCQFNRDHHDHVDIHNDTIDFSAGHKSRKEHDYEYHGKGLKHGECGIKFRGGHFEHTKYFLYECRVKSVQNSEAWHYAGFMVQADDYKNMDYDLDPKEAIVAEGGNIDIKGVADQKLHTCQFISTPNKYMNFDEGPDSHHPILDADSKHRYFGSSLSSKTCGISLRNVSSDMNGYIIGWASSGVEHNLRRDMTRLIVATAPDTPKLQLNRISSSEYTTSEFVAGDFVHATCTVANSRPVSNLTWLLGDDVVRQDTEDESEDNEDKWWWSYDPQNITQHWYISLEMKHDGKELTCRAEHVALPSGTISTSIRITVKPRHIRYWVWFLAVLLVLVGAVGVAAIVLYTGGRFTTAKTGTGVQFTNLNENADDSLPFENMVDFDTSD